MNKIIIITIIFVLLPHMLLAFPGEGTEPEGRRLFYSGTNKSGTELQNTQILVLCPGDFTPYYISGFICRHTSQYKTGRIQ